MPSPFTHLHSLLPAADFLERLLLCRQCLLKLVGYHLEHIQRAATVGPRFEFLSFCTLGVRTLMPSSCSLSVCSCST